MQPEAVVRAAAAAHGVLLERAQAWCRLTRVEDLRAGAVDEVDVARRQRGDATETGEEVQRSPFAREHGTGAAFDRRDLRGHLGDAVSFLEQRLDDDVRIERLEDRAHGGNTA